MIMLAAMIHGSNILQENLTKPIKIVQKSSTPFRIFPSLLRCHMFGVACQTEMPLSTCLTLTCNITEKLMNFDSFGSYSCLVPFLKIVRHSILNIQGHSWLFPLPPSPICAPAAPPHHDSRVGGKKKSI